MLSQNEVYDIMKFKEKPASQLVISRRKNVLGVGVNDAWYQTSYIENGKSVKCPFFSRWSCMITRCYGESYQKRCKTYEGSTVCDEWLSFSNFRAWMESEQWDGNQLDKDILGNGRKIYSPDTCLFVTQRVNSLFRSASPGKTSSRLGVSFSKNSGLYMAYGWDGVKNTQLGGFVSEDDASKAYCDFKYKVIAMLAEDQPEKVKDAMLKYRIEGSAPPPVEHVASTIRNDVAQLLHSRIKELEDMIVELLGDYQCSASCAEIEGYPTEYLKLSEKADKLVKKGVSL